MRAEKPERPTRRGAAFVAVREDGSVLLRTRPDSGLLGGMTEPPGTVWDAGTTPSRAGAPFPADWRDAGTVVHVFTHFRLELTVYCAHVGRVKKAPSGCWWSSSSAISGEALPSVMKKAIEAALPGSTRKSAA